MSITGCLKGLGIFEAGNCRSEKSFLLGTTGTADQNALSATCVPVIYCWNPTLTNHKHKPQALHTCCSQSYGPRLVMSILPAPNIGHQSKILVLGTTHRPLYVWWDVIGRSGKPFMTGSGLCRVRMDMMSFYPLQSQMEPPTNLYRKTLNPKHELVSFKKM